MLIALASFALADCTFPPLACNETTFIGAADFSEVSTNTCSSDPHDGGEIAVPINVPEGQRAVVSTHDTSDLADLFLLAGQCDWGATCIGASQTQSTGTERVEFTGHGPMSALVDATDGELLGSLQVGCISDVPSDARNMAPMTCGETREIPRLDVAHWSDTLHFAPCGRPSPDALVTGMEIVIPIDHPQGGDVSVQFTPSEDVNGADLYLLTHGRSPEGCSGSNQSGTATELATAHIATSDALIVLERGSETEEEVFGPDGGTLSLDCIEDCSDGADNTEDAMIDCDDPDCALDPDCVSDTDLPETDEPDDTDVDPPDTDVPDTDGSSGGLRRAFCSCEAPQGAAGVPLAVGLVWLIRRRRV